MVITELLSNFADPEIIHTLSVAEKLIAGIVATILGMGITFTALMILQLGIVLMDKLTERPVKTGAAVLQTPRSETQLSEPASSDHNELIAVISAVIALQLKTPVNNIVIKKIEKVGTPSSAWNRAGIIEQMNSRFLQPRRPLP